MVLRLENYGSLTTAIGQCGSFFFSIRTLGWPLETRLAWRYLGDPISIEKMVGRWAGNRAGWTTSPALMGLLTFFGMKVPDRALEHAWSIGRMSAS